MPTHPMEAVRNNPYGPPLQAGRFLWKKQEKTDALSIDKTMPVCYNDE